jgi:hypothetical protein
VGLDSTDLGQGLVAGYCECGDEPSGSCATELVETKNKKLADTISTQGGCVSSI